MNEMKFLFKYKEIENFSKFEELYIYKINISQLKNDNNDLKEYKKLNIECKLNYSDEIVLKIYFINNINEKKESKYQESIKIEEDCFFSKKIIQQKKTDIKKIIEGNKDSNDKYEYYSQKRNDIQRKILQLKSKFSKEKKIIKTLNEQEDKIKKLDKKEQEKKEQELKEIEITLNQIENDECCTNDDDNKYKTELIKKKYNF